jgi:hypothetical protein
MNQPINQNESVTRAQDRTNSPKDAKRTKTEGNQIHHRTRSHLPPFHWDCCLPAFPESSTRERENETKEENLSPTPLLRRRLVVKQASSS